MASPVVSINLCCYNSEEYLKETLDSIAAQSFKNWELVIINDGSSDSTESIIDEYIDMGLPITYHYQENKGLGYSRNEALKRSNGEFIAFIDHDDVWLPRKLEKQIPLFNDGKVGLVYCNTFFYYEATGKEQRYYSRKPPVGWVFSEILSDYFLSMETVVLRRSALDSMTHWFDDRFNLIEETDLFTRIAHDWKVDYVDQPLARWRIHQGNQTSARIGGFADELLIMLEKYAAIYSDFEKKYAEPIAKVKARAAYRKAQGAWQGGHNDIVRRLLQPWIRKDPRLIIPYALSFLTYSQYQKVFDALRRFR